MSSVSHPASLRDRFLSIVLADPLTLAGLAVGRAVNPPGWRVVSGVLYNAVWNALTGRPAGYGVRDVDLLYCDASDLSYEAEDRVIRAAAAASERAPTPPNAPIEVRNQARVHLWYKARFGARCPPLTSVEDAIDKFAARAHAVGLRVGPDGAPDLYAPFGLEDVFAMRLRPNPALDTAATYAAKAARAAALWPEITVEPWPTR